MTFSGLWQKCWFTQLDRHAHIWFCGLLVLSLLICMCVLARNILSQSCCSLCSYVCIGLPRPTHPPKVKYSLSACMSKGKGNRVNLIWENISLWEGVLVLEVQYIHMFIFNFLSTDLQNGSQKFNYLRTKYWLLRILVRFENHICRYCTWKFNFLQLENVSISCGNEIIKRCEFINCRNNQNV